MRLILFLIIFFSNQSFSQVKKVRDNNRTEDYQLSQPDNSSSVVNQFSAVKFSNNDSLAVNTLITSSGDTIAPISEYKIFNDKIGVTFIDTVLNIKKQYAFNYLRKDLFGLVAFNNDGQTYQALTPASLRYDNIINFGFNARRFSYLNKEDINYYSVPTPASELLYRSVTGKGQNLDAFITVNTTERLNFFIGYRGMRSQGKYVNQLTSNGNFQIGATYSTANRRYQLRNHFTFQDISNDENGGIVDVSMFNQSVEPYNNRETITVQTEFGSSFFKGLRGYFDHSFQINRSESNKALIRHQFTYEYFSNSYQQQNANPFNINLPYYGFAFAGGVNDKVRHSRIENNLDIAFDSKKIGLFAVTAAVYNFNHGYQSIVINENGERIPHRLKDDILTIGGSYFINKEYLNADVAFKQSILGRSLTDFKINAAFNLNENYGVAATYHLQNKIPDYTYQLFQSGFIGMNWFNDFSNETYSTLNAQISSPWINLEGTYQIISNKIFYSNDAVALKDDARYAQLIISPKQYAKAINYFMIKAQKEFIFNKWGIDNSVMFQQTIQDDPIFNVPQIVTRNTIYFQDYAFGKALFFQTGIVFNYFTKYFANEYHPVVGDFLVQNHVKVGNFPVFDFFINAKIKTAHIYININHFNAMFTGYNYYNTPTYPYRDLTFRIGMKWNFFN